jgi:hypothetical protein
MGRNPAWLMLRVKMKREIEIKLLLACDTGRGKTAGWPAGKLKALGGESKC